MTNDEQMVELGIIEVELPVNYIGFMDAIIEHAHKKYGTEREPAVGEWASARSLIITVALNKLYDSLPEDLKLAITPKEDVNNG